MIETLAQQIQPSFNWQPWATAFAGLCTLGGATLVTYKGFGNSKALEKSKAKRQHDENQLDKLADHYSELNGLLEAYLLNVYLYHNFGAFGKSVVERYEQVGNIEPLSGTLDDAEETVERHQKHLVENTVRPHSKIQQLRFLETDSARRKNLEKIYDAVGSMHGKTEKADFAAIQKTINDLFETIRLSVNVDRERLIEKGGF